MIRVYFDFEFNHSERKDMNVVCCSMDVFDDEDKTEYDFWLHNDESEAKRLCALCSDLREKGAIFFAYLASAECRSLESLGFDTMRLNVIDVYVEFRQLKMNNNRRTYGRYLRKNGISNVNGELKYDKTGYSHPPSLVKEDNEGKDNTEVGNGYADAACNLLGVVIDTNHKKAMRDLILSEPDEFTLEDRNSILEYCRSDIRHLPDMMNKIAQEVQNNFNLSESSYLEIAICRGRFAGPVTARIEREGIPFDLEAANNLSDNVDDARNSMLKAYIERVDKPFYIAQKRTLKDFRGVYVDRYSLFAEYVLESLKMDSWALTESGRLSKNNDDLKEFDGDPNIGPYRQVRKALKGLESFDPQSKAAKKSGIVMDSVDPEDCRLRTLFGVFGTMTGRNAPRARRFPFAMGRWCRSLLKPPKGWSIGSIDWASQEVMVGAVLSGDENMMEAYTSGDPYMSFAIQAGAAPQGATKKSHSDVRSRFKATFLAVGFGMGKTKLARKLTVDCGRPFTEKESGKLIQLHRKVFKIYWRWRRHVLSQYKRDGFLLLADGWGLNAHCDRETSIGNFPVQGTAAVILRRAVTRAVEQGIPVISPLHDAIYICCPDEEFDKQMKALSEVMTWAVTVTLGHFVIGQDPERHDGTSPWIETGAEEVYDALSPYMQKRDTPERTRIKVLHDLFENNQLQLLTNNNNQV